MKKISFVVAGTNFFKTKSAPTYFAKPVLSTKLTYNIMVGVKQKQGFCSNFRITNIFLSDLKLDLKRGVENFNLSVK